ncbi:MAG: hypothetical protein IKA76_06090 [Clostridia bacterium]|nr:hypothetical protein [Clostridia bacterium]
MKRKNRIKTLLSFALALIMLGSMTVPVFAAQKEETTIEPQWTSIFTMDVDLAFVGNEGCAAGSARKQSTASHISGTLYVYKWTGSTWEVVGDAAGSKTVGTLGLVVDFIAEVGVQYKAVLTVAAYTNGIGEWESIECHETFWG